MSTVLPIDLPTPQAPGLDWERLDASFPWLRTLAGCPQDPVHHAEGDVAVHTRMVCEAMVSLTAWQALPQRERAIALAAGLFHDIAKPATTRCDEHGRVSAPGHSRRGESMARATLYRMGVDFHTREAIAALVRYHQDPFFLIDRPDALRRAITIAERVRGDLLAVLAEADMRGRVCEDAARPLDNVALYRAHCDEHGLTQGRWAFANATSRFEFFRREGRDPSYAAWEDTDAFEVVLMSGLPGAGKDTWARAHLAERPIISLDALREALDAEPTGDQGAVVMAAKERARVLLRARTPFVWNATNITRQRRAELVALFTDYGARVRIVYIEPAWATLRAQNRGRHERRVPRDVIERMVDRWEPPDDAEAHVVERHVA